MGLRNGSDDHKSSRIAWQLFDKQIEKNAAEEMMKAKAFKPLLLLNFTLLRRGRDLNSRVPKDRGFLHKITMIAILRNGQAMRPRH